MQECIPVSPSSDLSSAADTCPLSTVAGLCANSLGPCPEYELICPVTPTRQSLRASQPARRIDNFTPDELETIVRHASKYAGQLTMSGVVPGREGSECKRAWT